MRSIRQFDEIDAFISNALTVGILDKKSIMQIKDLMKKSFALFDIHLLLSVQKGHFQGEGNF